MSVLQVEKKIKSRVKNQMERTQREYYLNEQMKAIQRELGDGEESAANMAELEERIAATNCRRRRATRPTPSLKKLKNMSPMRRRGHRGAQLPRLDAVDPVGREVGA